MDTSIQPLFTAEHATCRMPKTTTAAADDAVRLPSLFRGFAHRHDDVEFKTIFSDVAFTLHRGDIVDLVGPSGTGKSTLLTTVAQLNPYASADLTLEGTPSTAMTPERWRREVAYLPQRPTLTGASVREAILMPFTLRVHRFSDDGSSLDERRPDEATLRRTLDTVGCSDIELERPPQDLSVGQQARVCLLRTLLTLPKVMLADEVDAGLDEENADKVGEILAYAAREKGMAIVRVRHRAADGRATRTLHLEAGVLTEITGNVAAVPAQAHGNERTESEATR